MPAFRQLPPQVAADLDVLIRSGVVPAADADYWRTNAVTGKTCDGARVADLLLSIARKLGETGSFDRALDLLMKRGVIWNDYWKDNAKAGKPCNGEYVGNLIRAAAGPVSEAELLTRYRIPGGLLPSPASTPFAAVKTPETFDYVIGTQTFSPAYQFTRQPKLLETARAIREMGASVIKFELSRRYARQDGNVPTANPAIRTLTDLVRDEPTHRQVLEMPFADYVLWAHSFTGGGDAGWRNGLSRENGDREYREIYDLTAHLLKTYAGTGKRFFLGHWEGDGWLRGSVAVENDARVTPAAVQGMVDWLNTRQRAIEDARRANSVQNVSVWHYTEVNHVRLAMEGRKAVVNEVLPKTSVDFVSYSSYDTARNPELLKAALSFIESKLPKKSGMVGRRVFIGEYGFPKIGFPPDKQDALSRQVMRAALEWGCPFCLYWEMYNNEVDPDGTQRGFWLIDDKGVKQPVYHTHQRFLTDARRFVEAFHRDKRRVPNSDEFRKAALTWLTP